MIDHVKILRIHSRLPVVLPERVTTGLLNALKSTHLKPVMVIHCNHPHEIDEHVTQAMLHLHSAGIAVLNQSVLLKEINDSAAVLAELSEKLFAIHVLPYYLHLLDKVTGVQHFEVTETAAKAIHQQLQQCLPGYLVPRLVREIAGAPAKVWIF